MMMVVEVGIRMGYQVKKVVVSTSQKLNVKMWSV